MTTIIIPKPTLRFSVIRKETGFGHHKDRRTKRNRTRSAQRRNAIQDT